MEERKGGRGSKLSSNQGIQVFSKVICAKELPIPTVWLQCFFPSQSLPPLAPCSLIIAGTSRHGLNFSILLYLAFDLVISFELVIHHSVVLAHLFCLPGVKMQSIPVIPLLGILSKHPGFSQPCWVDNYTYFHK